MPSREARGAERVRGRAGQPGQLLVAEPGPLDRGEQLGRPRRPPRRRGARRSPPRPVRAPRSGPSRRGTRPRCPVASPTIASGTPRRSRPSSRHRRESDGSRNRRRTIGRRGPLGVRVDSHAWPCSSIQRIGSSVVGVARVDARPGSRRSASSSGPRPAARRRPARDPGAPCSAPSRTSGRWPSPRPWPSSGCRASGRRSGTCRTGSAAA